MYTMLQQKWTVLDTKIERSCKINVQNKLLLQIVGLDCRTGLDSSRKNLLASGGIVQQIHFLTVSESKNHKQQVPLTVPTSVD